MNDQCECPHCGAMIENVSELFDCEHVDEMETECDACGNEVRVTMNVSVDYKATKIKS